jgi:hypothetical protein
MRIACPTLLVSLFVLADLSGQAALARPASGFVRPFARSRFLVEHPDAMYVDWQFSLRITQVNASAGTSTPSYGWHLLIGFSAIAVASLLLDLILRRAGGWRAAHLLGALASRRVRLALAIIVTGGVGVVVGGSARDLTGWLALITLALVETFIRAEPAARRRMVSAATLWLLLALVLSIDVSNQQYGPLKLLDDPARFLALCLIGAFGSVFFFGWVWPTTLGLAWTGAVTGSLLLFAARDGSQRYLDVWRALLPAKEQPPFLWDIPTQIVASSADLIVLAVVGGSVVFASSALCCRATSAGAPGDSARAFYHRCDSRRAQPGRFFSGDSTASGRRTDLRLDRPYPAGVSDYPRGRHGYGAGRGRRDRDHAWHRLHLATTRLRCAVRRVR